MNTEIETVISDLEKVDVFGALDVEELAALAEQIVPSTVTPGTAVVVQGEFGNSLFIVRTGELRVYLTESGEEIDLGTLRPADYFGEMSLLTGAPRSATVVATADSDLLEITKVDLVPLMARHPSLAARMVETLTARQESNLKKMMEHPALSKRAAADDHAADAFERAWQVADSIKAYFGLPESIWSRAADVGGNVLAAGDTGLGALHAVQRQLAFTAAVVALAGKMAAAAGFSGDEALQALRDAFAIEAADMRDVRRIFEDARAKPKDFASHAGRIAAIFADDPAMLEELLSVLLSIAAAGGDKRAAMEIFAHEVADVFDIGDGDFERLRATVRFGAGDDASNGASGDFDPLAVLGITGDATPEAAQAAHQRLAVDNHPKHLMQRGLPVECMLAANRKLATINRAYERFQAGRGIAGLQG